MHLVSVDKSQVDLFFCHPHAHFFLLSLLLMTSKKIHLGAWNSNSSVHNSFTLQRCSQELVLILSVSDQYIYNPAMC